MEVSWRRRDGSNLPLQKILAGHGVLGIDTIKVLLPITSGMVRSDNVFSIRCGTSCVRERLLYVDDTGFRQMGISARIRRNGVDVRIKPVSRNKGVLKLGLMGCFVQFSVSGILKRGDNTRPATKGEMSQVFQHVQIVLHEVGVDADFFKGKVCRIDLFANLALRETTSEYLPVLASLEPPRYRKLIFTNGIVYSCREQGINIYGKAEERRAKVFRNSDITDNVMRVEWQIKRTRAVVDKLSIYGVDDIIEKFDQFPAAYINRVNSLLFINEFDTSLTTIHPKRDQIKAQVKTFLRWLRGRNIELPITQAHLVRITKSKGIERFARIVRETPALKNEPYVSIRLKQIRIAAFRDALDRDPMFVFRYKELREAMQNVII